MVVFRYIHRTLHSSRRCRWMFVLPVPFFLTSVCFLALQDEIPLSSLQLADRLDAPTGEKLHHRRPLALFNYTEKVAILRQPEFISSDKDGDTTRKLHSRRRPPPQPPLPRPRLYIFPIGGLGNQLFQAASCVGIALSTRREPTLSPAFEQLFQMINLSLAVRDPPFSLPQLSDRGFATFTPAVYRQTSSDVVLSGFFQSWRYFQSHEAVIRSQFRLVEHLWTFGARVRQSACDVICSRHRRCNWSPVYIGVHVRRNHVKPNYSLVPSSFFHTAIKHFQRKYRGAIFVIVCDDVEWCKTHINGDAVYVVPEMTADKHFAVLSGCHHHVVSVGTYGWWAAWLAGGDTVYYDDPVPKTFLHSNEFSSGDYFPKQWTPLH